MFLREIFLLFDGIAWRRKEWEICVPENLENYFMAMNILNEIYSELEQAQKPSPHRVIHIHSHIILKKQTNAFIIKTNKEKTKNPDLISIIIIFVVSQLANKLMSRS